jgi:hypothetical protein
VRFDIYGRFEIEVTREGGAWVAYRIEPGKRIGMPDLALPAALAEHEIAVFPDDLYHEMSKSGQTICAL